MEPYRITPHTAEVGLEAAGKTLAELFANAAGGLLHLWGLKAGGKSAEKTQSRVSLRGEDASDLLVVWLNELAFVVQTRHIRPGEIRIATVTETALEAEILGTLAPDARDLAVEIKSATRAGPLVKKTKAGWTASVILDV